MPPPRPIKQEPAQDLPVTEETPASHDAAVQVKVEVPQPRPRLRPAPEVTEETPDHVAKDAAVQTKPEIPDARPRPVPAETATHLPRITADDPIIPAVFVITPQPPAPLEMFFIIIAVIPTVSLFIMLLIAFILFLRRPRQDSRRSLGEEGIPLQEVPPAQPTNGDDPAASTPSPYERFDTLRQRTPPPRSTTASDTTSISTATTTAGSSTTIPFPYATTETTLTETDLRLETEAFAQLGRSHPSTLPPDDDDESTTEFTAPPLRRSQRIAAMVKARKEAEEIALECYAAAAREGREGEQTKGKKSKGKGKGKGKGKK